MFVCAMSHGYVAYGCTAHSAVVLLPHENGKQSGKHLWCERPIALIHTPDLTIHTHIRDTQLIMMPGFEERMSTFSQEQRALNPVRIVVVMVYDMCGRGDGGGGGGGGGVQSHARTFKDHSCLKEIV